MVKSVQLQKRLDKGELADVRADLEQMAVLLTKLLTKVNANKGNSIAKKMKPEYVRKLKGYLKEIEQGRVVKFKNFAAFARMMD
ncbi:MAG: hypothetical protein KGH53_02715 [Candidatus Micrarchaeota archaeon]|nr:hypothetical protein [Candidatus Micrarchaeota archaeon]